MKNIFSTLLIILIVTFNLINLKAYSQHDMGTNGSAPLDTYTITLTNKDGKTSLNSPTSGLNIKVAPGGQDVAGLDTGASLKANGIIPILTNVDTTTNIITVVWSGGITEGKAIVTGKLKQGSTIASVFTVVKVEKDGGKDITGDLNITVNLSSSTQASSSSSGSTITSTSSSGGTTTSSSSGSTANAPSISLTGPDQFIVKKLSSNIFKLKVKGTNFTKAVRCTLDVSDDSLLRVKPKRFILSPARSAGLLLAKVPFLEVKDLVDNDSAEVVTIDVSCTNDAADSIDIILAATDQQ